MSDLKVNSISGNTSTGVHIPGHVIQTVTHAFSDNTSITTYGTTYTDITNAAITITPKHSNSKILIMPNLVFYMSISSSTYVYGGIRLLRGSSTVVAPTNSIDGNGAYDYGYSKTTAGTSQLDLRHCGHHVDTPATTSATTYKFQGINYASGRTMVFNGAGGSSSIVAMEIAV